jgi:hypothetical protein
MVRSRSVREQVISGFRIAGSLLLAIAVFAALSLGFALITQNISPNRQPRVLLGSTLVLLLDAFLFLTARYWAKWLLGVFACGSLRLFVGGILLGPYLSHPIDRRSAVLWFLYALAASALTVRYLRRQPKRLESIGLVLFVSCIALATVVSSSSTLFAGLAALGVSELLQWASTRAGRSRVATPHPTH